jgi:hypothetical protein
MCDLYSIINSDVNELSSELKNRSLILFSKLKFSINNKILILMTQNDQKLQNRMQNFSIRSLLKNLPIQNPAQV